MVATQASHCRTGSQAGDPGVPVLESCRDGGDRATTIWVRGIDLLHHGVDQVAQVLLEHPARSSATAQTSGVSAGMGDPTRTASRCPSLR